MYSSRDFYEVGMEKSAWGLIFLHKGLFPSVSASAPSGAVVEGY